MTVADQIKILNIKVMQNEAQSDLDRKAAKITASSSNNLDKYEYLTGEDLDYKPSAVEQARFEYFPLGKIFNKGLKKDKKEGILKRLKNIENENEEMLKAIKYKTENIKEVIDFVEETLSLQAKGLIEEIKIIQKDVDYIKLKTTGGNNIAYDFSDYKTFKELFRDLYYKNMSINEAERKKNEFDRALRALSTYPAKKKKYIEAKNKLLNNVKTFTREEKKLLKCLKMEYFRLFTMRNKKDNLDTKKKKIISEMITVLLIIKTLRD